MTCISANGSPLGIFTLTPTNKFTKTHTNKNDLHINWGFSCEQQFWFGFFSLLFYFWLSLDDETKYRRINENKPPTRNIDGSAGMVGGTSYFVPPAPHTPHRTTLTLLTHTKLDNYYECLIGHYSAQSFGDK